MTPEESKARAKLDAAARAATASTSQVNNAPPQVYRVPRMNMPKDLAELTQLLHGELTKIEQSQSLIMSIYDQLNGEEGFLTGDGSESVRFRHLVIGDDPDNGGYSYIDFFQGAEQLGYVGYGNPNRDLQAYNTAYSKSRPNGFQAQSGGWTGMYGALDAAGTPAVLWLDAAGMPYVQATWQQTSTLTVVNYVIGDGRMLRSALNYNMGSPNGGSLTQNCDTAPMDTTVFCYYNGYVMNAAPVNGVMHTFTGLGGGYVGQLTFDYSGNGLWWRTRNGDNGVWNGWRSAASTARVREVDSKVRTRIRALEMEVAELKAQLTTVNPN